ncbi:hypothetical protein HZB96_02730 [Candidatus Gottesmanbacteria bacterium]|nr:hypothetical protein [Candidatus Gottesmanbacteria bacterium]
MTNFIMNKTLNLLLSGKHPKAKKFAGKHVIVVENEVVPLKKGKAGVEDIIKLEKKYRKPSTLVFVPHRNISLGINLKSDCEIENTKGIGGTERVYQYSKLPCKIGNWQKEIPVGFLDRDDIPPLLGRLACLELMRLVFEKRKSIFEI